MAKSKMYELMLKIGGKTDSSLKAACAAADKNLASLGTAARNAGKVVAGAAVAAAATVGTIGVAAVKAASEYEVQLAKVSTLLTGTEAEVAARTSEIGDQILAVSNKTGVVTADLTDGMYQVVSAFGDSSDAIHILETAAKSAAAGGATTTDAINLLSAVTKGYGDTSAEAVQKAADLSFATVRLGQTSFPELAAGMGKIIPLASTLGVEQEQLFGAMSTLTGGTGSTAEVVTQLKATMQGYLSPSKSMTAALKTMGYESGQALLESKGLQGSLEALKDAVGGDELAFAGLFSSVEAQTAVLAMAGTQAENLTGKTAEMYVAAGAADTAFARQTDTMQYTIQTIKNLGANFLTELGTNVLPYVKDLAEAALPKVQDALQKAGTYVVGTIIPAAKETVGWIREHSGVVMALAGAVGSMVATYKIAKGALAIYNTVTSVAKVLAVASASATAGQTAATAAQTAATAAQAATTAGAIAPTTALAAATNALCLPLLAVVAAIAAVVAVVILLVKNWDKVKAAALAVWAKIKAVWSTVATWFHERVITPVVNFFSGVVGAVTGFFSRLWANIKGVWNAVASWFKNRVITPLVNFFTPIINTISGIFRGAWIIIQAVWKAVSTWFNTYVITPVVSIFSTVVEAVSGFFSTLWGNIVAVWTAVSTWFNDNVITPVVSVFSTIVEAVGGFFTGLWANIVAVWTAAGAWFSEYVAAPIQNAFRSVSDFVKGIFNAMIGFVESMINHVIGAINKFIGGFSNLVGAAAAFIGVEWGGIPELPRVTLPRLATGGIVTAPTILEAGEGGEPEAILPLSKLAAMLEKREKSSRDQGRAGAPEPQPGRERDKDPQAGGGEQIVFSPVFNFYGPANKEEAQEAARLSFAEFKRMWNQLQAEKQRKRFANA